METNTVTEKGKRRRRTNLELVLTALRNLAIEGNVSAVQAYQAYLAKFGPQHRIVRGMALIPAPLTIEEQMAEGERLNKLADARRREQLMEKARRSAGQSPESGGPSRPAGTGRGPS